MIVFWAIASVTFSIYVLVISYIGILSVSAGSSGDLVELNKINTISVEQNLSDAPGFLSY